MPWGVVQEFHPEEGWGVIQADVVPGGCWVGFTVIHVEGYRALAPGATVDFSYEEAEQDGYRFRATDVWPEGTARSAGPLVRPPSGSGAFSARITIRRRPG